MNLESIAMQLQALRQQALGIALQCDAIIASLVTSPEQATVGTPLTFMGQGQQQEQEDLHTMGYKLGYHEGIVGTPLKETFGDFLEVDGDIHTPVPMVYIAGYHEGWKDGHNVFLLNAGVSVNV